RADAEEDIVNLVESLVLGVEDGDRSDEHERWQHEGDRNRECSARAGFEVPEPHRHLCRERPGHGLADREALLELGLGEPSAILDEIALHVPDERDRATEAAAAELQEVTDEAAER